MKILYVVSSNLISIDSGIALFVGLTKTCLRKLNIWPNSGKVAPIFNGVIGDNSVNPIFSSSSINISLGIVGQTLDNIILSDGGSGFCRMIWRAPAVRSLLVNYRCHRIYGNFIVCTCLPRLMP